MMGPECASIEKSGAGETRRAWRAAAAAAVLLSAATLAAYWPVLGNGFIGWDDGTYVTRNPQVTGGLTWENVGWAFRTGYASNWHPLTWLSHLLDAQLYGLKPRGHHLTSLLLHTANAVLLFWLLRRWTGSEWRSGLVAGLFALHPLHVESVAWVAERKDVLSTCFFLLTLGAYGAYAARVEGRRKRTEKKSTVHSPQSTVENLEAEVRNHASRVTHHAWFWYVLALGLFACGLMSKPMLVTTPFVLLLLDFWPFDRLGARLGRPGCPQADAARLDPVGRPLPGGALKLAGIIHRFLGARQCSGRSPEIEHQESNLKKLLALGLEKVPFFCLAIAASVVTFLVQEKSHAMLLRLPLGSRLANAVASYWKYLGKTLWPADLAVYYPHPDARYPISQQWPLWAILAGALLLAGLSIGAALGARRRPWAMTGWFWYLGTLVPVIGIIQVGGQAMADRYTYIPLIGVFVVFAWGAAEFCARAKLSPAVFGSAAALVLLACAMATRAQVKYWRSNLTLFEHALQVAPNSAPAHFELGCAIGGQGDFDAAIRHFRAALKADPGYMYAYYGLGLMFEGLGRPAAAVEQYEAGLRLAPWSEQLHDRLGAAWLALGRREQAVKELTEAVRLDPKHAEAHYRLGVALAGLGRQKEAASHVAEALRLGPNDLEILNGVAWMLATHPLASVRNGAEAVRLAERACQLSGGKDPQYLGTLDAAYAEDGRFEDAIKTAERARELALAADEKGLAQAAEYRLGLYRNRQAFHEMQPNQAGRAGMD